MSQMRIEHWFIGKKLELTKDFYDWKVGTRLEVLSEGAHPGTFVVQSYKGKHEDIRGCFLRENLMNHAMFFHEAGPLEQSLPESILVWDYESKKLVRVPFGCKKENKENEDEKFSTLPGTSTDIKWAVFECWDCKKEFLV